MTGYPYGYMNLDKDVDDTPVSPVTPLSDWTQNPMQGYNFPIVAPEVIDTGRYMSGPEYAEWNFVHTESICTPLSFVQQGTLVSAPALTFISTTAPLPSPPLIHSDTIEPSEDDEDNDEDVLSSTSLDLSLDLPIHTNTSLKPATAAATTTKTKTAPGSGLRTRKRTPQRPGSGILRSVVNPDHNTLRQAHNEVEQQYRLRLNGQFEDVLAALPESYRERAWTTDRNGGGRRRRRVSKAETLDMARRYMEALQEEVRQLQREKGEWERKMKKGEEKRGKKVKEEK